MTLVHVTMVHVSVILSPIPHQPLQSPKPTLLFPLTPVPPSDPSNHSSPHMRKFIRACLYHPTHGYFPASCSPKSPNPTITPRSPRTFFALPYLPLLEGYFTSNASAVGALSQPINFRQLAGRREWVALQQSLYSSADTSWFTPSELFQPWYGYAVADFILSTHPPTKPLKIYEVGGGGGTLARNILDRLQAKAPAVHRRCRYTSVEISPALAQRQRERITGHTRGPLTASHGAVAPAASHGAVAPAASHGAVAPAASHGAVAPASTAAAAATAPAGSNGQAPAASAASADRRAPRGARGRARDSSVSRDASIDDASRRCPHELVHSVAVFDAADVRGWGAPSNEPCFILLFEVLDNLPHDRVQWSRESSEWEETRVKHAGREGEAEEKERAGKRHDGEVEEARRRHLEGREGAGRLYENKSPTSATASSSSNSITSSGGGGMLARLSASLQGLLASVVGGERVIWLPTGCLRLLEAIYTARPHATVIAADFSLLPDVRIPGANAPLVAAKGGGVTEDQPTYLVPRGSADIFFPTDFGLLERLDAAACAPTSVERIRGSITSADFLSTIAASTYTKDGFNPLLHDFLNTPAHTMAAEYPPPESIPPYAGGPPPTDYAPPPAYPPTGANPPPPAGYADVEAGGGAGKPPAATGGGSSGSSRMSTFIGVGLRIAELLFCMISFS
ncbi:unnamed protein product [Closterium sp. NIES-53]